MIYDKVIVICSLAVDFRASKGGLVEPTPEIERELKSELERVAKIYGGKPGDDMTKFPSFDFKEIGRASCRERV